MTISRRAFLRGLSATAGIAALAGCDLLDQADGDGIEIIPPARSTDQPDPNATPTVEPDTWHEGAPMPTPRIGVAGAAAHGRIHVIGGWAPDGISDAHEAYDPTTNRWQAAAPLPLPIAEAASVSVDGAIYLVGGVKKGLRPLAEAWRYDPSADTWDQIQPLPTPRGGLSAAVAAGKIYAVGGYSNYWTKELSALEAYDVSNDQWEPFTPMPTPRMLCAVGVVRAKILIAGGRSSKTGGTVNDNEIYDP